MKNMYVEISNGYSTAGGAKVVDLGYTEEEFRALPSMEQDAILKDAAAESMDIGVKIEKNSVIISVSLGYVGCVAKTEAEYTPEQWHNLYPEEQEEHIIECAWECVDYWEVAK